MIEAHQLAVRRQLMHRIPLQHGGIVLQIIENLRIQHHKAAVDDGALRLILLPEGPHLSVCRHIQYTLLLHETHGGQGCNAAMLLVEAQKPLQIHIRHAVTVGQHEGLIPDVALNPLDAAAGHGIETGIHHRHLPVLRGIVVHLHLVVGHVEGDVRIVQKIIGEKLLDDILLIARQDDKLPEAIGGVVLHDMPENRHLTDLDHGLRLQMRLLRNPGTEAARKNCNLHIRLRRLTRSC